MCVWVYILRFLYMYVCMFVCICKYVYIHTACNSRRCCGRWRGTHTHARTHTHTHTHTQAPRQLRCFERVRIRASYATDAHTCLIRYAGAVVDGAAGVRARCCADREDEPTSCFLRPAPRSTRARRYLVDPQYNLNSALIQPCNSMSKAWIHPSSLISDRPAIQRSKRLDAALLEL
jgi:hypothetical protein